MTATKKDPVIVVLQLTGGNDYMNTVIPHADPRYRDNRPVVGVPDGRIVKLNDSIGFHPEVGPLKRFWDAGDMAIIHGVGYATARAAISAAWTSGTLASRTSWGRKGGWAAPRATWIPTRAMSLRR